MVRHTRRANVAVYFSPCRADGTSYGRAAAACRQILPSLSAARPLSGTGGGPKADATQAADAYLVQRARDGYVDAYAELVDRHGGLAYRVALRLLGSHQDAEDVAQEALVLAWQQLPGFKGESSFPTWLYRIVTRRALNRMTRTRVADSLDLLADVADSGPGPARDVERDLTVDAVTAAVAALPPPSAWLSSCTTSRAWPTRRSPASRAAPPGPSVAICSAEGAH